MVKENPIELEKNLEKEANPEKYVVVDRPVNHNQ